jgi:NAD(P)-dependent dehydrogenase (short-subunit alcohol dehydrogenase family)
MTETALITGGAKRIGRAFCLALAESGCDIAVHYSNSKDSAEQVVEEAKKFGVNACAIRADFNNNDEINSLVDQAREKLGKNLSLLINNASTFEPDSMLDVTLESWDKHLNSNTKAPLFLTSAFAHQAPKALKDLNGEDIASANVINMIDQKVLRLTPWYLTYTLGKTALWTLTRTMAQGLAPHIRVNAIGPGPILKAKDQTEKDFHRQRGKTPLKRGSDTKELVRTLNYILQSPGLTGQMICIDGGEHLKW